MVGRIKVRLKTDVKVAIQSVDCSNSKEFKTQVLATSNALSINFDFAFGTT